jgi:glutamate synthase (NADPH/NADH) small chain
VVVYERADKVGGLLRYGIPEFKMEKYVLDRRINQMEGEGTRFRAGVNVGVDVTGAELKKKYDAIVLAIGATQWRDIDIPGRENKGVYQAMEYLPWGNKQGLQLIDGNPPINATGKHVVILGGGDTGADCLGTAVRQGAASVTQLEIMPRPTGERPAGQPWPTYPMIYRVSSAHEELDNRIFSVSTESFVGDGNGNLKAVKIVETKFENGKFEKVPGTERELPADLVFLAMGFTGPEKSDLISQFGVALDERGNIKRNENFESSEEGIFVAGDAGRGQSLIVWAIAEGRSVASAVDKYLIGETMLPAPIEPTTRPLTV